ncbi:hypothetical protein M3J09_003162 [Ascochyta lentis]
MYAQRLVRRSWHAAKPPSRRPTITRRNSRVTLTIEILLIVKAPVRAASPTCSILAFPIFVSRCMNLPTSELF